ncbi:urea transporter 2 isoform X2 [Silurus meridionalis]|uniref:urea transporter 2 isoform X2 n=1 Tax=Silurus meridionalis TaxID=175797 RepID=UPI001EEBD137|nr:urea transporter 2 isoform X2 [Silurus meridionalis]
MFMSKKLCEHPKGLKQQLIQKLLYCTGEMEHFQKYMQALSIASPWQTLLGSLGLFSSTVMAILIGQERAEVSRGEHGYNGMLVALLIGVFSSAGEWYWWLLLPACLAGAATTFLHSGMAAVLDKWELPVSVFPFNTVLLLYLACTGIENPYFPNHPALPLGAALSINSTHVDIPQLMQGIVLGVGQIYACDAVGSSLIILSAVMLYSPVLAFHALLGSSLGVLAGLSVAVQQDALYTGLASFNGALGCMAVGGLLFTLSWRTHAFSIICAFLSSYADIALSNLLANVGLPSSSWAATLTISLMLLVSGRSLSTYRIAIGQDSSSGGPLHTPSQSAETNTDSSSA